MFLLVPTIFLSKDIYNVQLSKNEYGRRKTRKFEIMRMDDDDDDVIDVSISLFLSV